MKVQKFQDRKYRKTKLATKCEHKDRMKIEIEAENSCDEELKSLGTIYTEKKVDPLYKKDMCKINVNYKK